MGERVDEAGKRYKADADDAAYATFELADGVIAQINSSWTTRVRRDDLVTFLVDGTHGSAMAGLMKCWTQHRVNTPKPVWSPDTPQTIDFYETWDEVPDNEAYDNGFKVQWEMLLRHIVEDARSAFDWVVIDTPPAALLPDVSLLSMLVDGALLVVRAGQTPYPAIQRAIETIGQQHLLGVILNGAQPVDLKHYGYYAPHQPSATDAASA